MRYAFGMLFAVGTTYFATASDGDDTLKHFLKKTDVVVEGVIVSVQAPFSLEAGVVHYMCELRINDVIKGKVERGDTIAVEITRFEHVDADRSPYLRKGGECVLFLNNPVGGARKVYRTSDPWFGIQQGSPRLVSALKGVVALP